MECISFHNSKLTPNTFVSFLIEMIFYSALILLQVRFAECNLILNVFLPKGIARLQAKNYKLIDIIYKMLGQTSINQTSSYSVFCFIN